MSTPPGDVNRPRGLSVRVKLTLSYAGLLVAAGIAMFAVGFLILRFVPDGNLQVAGGGFAPNRTNLLEVFLRYATWAIALLAALGLGGGWLLAGVILRPLDRVTDAARRARDGTFSHRIRLTGPRDEITELADSFDAMLARVERTLDEERRFAANASHELRTPHATIRTMVEVARADPDGRDVDVLLRRIAETNERSITLTEALLALARVDRLAPDREALSLDDIVRRVLDDPVIEADAAGLRVSVKLEASPTRGNRALLTQLVTNLVRNASAHNLPTGGAVRVTTHIDGGAAVLDVENTGSILDPAIVPALTEPFVRGAGRVRADGVGLGLAIVASIVRAHGGAMWLTARAEGGLHVRVALPT
jgi:two-component system sensor histidine kinase VanS